MKNKNEGKHTPSWVVVDGVCCADGTDIGFTVSSIRDNSEDSDVVATHIVGVNDARLIAAAPELLDIVKRMNWAFYVDGTPKALRAVMSESKALISKTEGRE